MSDINSGLPIRSEADGLDQLVRVKIMDFTAPNGTGNQVTVANNAAFVRTFGLIPAGTPIAFRLSELGNVNSDGFYNVTSNTLPSTTGITAFTRAVAPDVTDLIQRVTSATPTGDGLVAANIHTLDTSSFLHGYNGTTWDRILSVGGALKVNVDTDGFYILATNSTPDTMGGIAHVRGATPDKTSLTFRNTGATANADTITPANVQALDVNSFLMGYSSTGSAWNRAQIFAGKLGAAIYDENGVAFSASNPLPTTSVDSEGNEVNDYNTVASVAAAASSNHDYTVTAATTLKLSEIQASASGKLKVTVQVETGVATAVFTTKFVQFNSTSNPNIVFAINENITVAAGVRVRVIRTNLDLLSMDCYSTVSGHEI